ncbi:MAG: acylphosphatase [Armatimonadetes bacterium]|nr:acylphosphatase [Armatimonadota bacterium]
MSHVADSERLHAIVSGRVQGVGFRYFVLRRAQSLGLNGWVRNLSSGDVEFVAEGPREALEELLRAVRQGPPMSWVERVRTDWSAARGDLRSFEVSYTL